MELITPWYCARAASAIEDVDAIASVHAADGRLLAIVQPGSPVFGELMAISPELLADLAGLLRALMQFDDDYCREHRIELDFSARHEALREAASNAVATLAYAVEHGLPVDIPGLPEMEAEL